MAEADAALEAPVAPAIPAPAMPSGSEAAAILLMLLGDEEAADVLRRLDPSEVQHLGAAMFDVENVSEDQVEQVLDIFMTKAAMANAVRLRTMSMTQPASHQFSTGVSTATNDLELIATTSPRAWS